MLTLIHRAKAAIRDRFALDDRGATAVEYALLVGLVSVVIISAVTALGTTLDTLFRALEAQLSVPSGEETIPM